MVNDNIIYKNVQYNKKSLYKTTNRTKIFDDLKHLICAKDKRNKKNVSESKVET